MHTIDQFVASAIQVKGITEKITGIVDVLEANALETQSTIGTVVQSIDEEKELIDSSKDTYIKMEKMFHQLYESVTNTESQLRNIVESNNAIVDSINQLSAASEEVAASMDMAVELSNNNMSITNEAKNLVDSLVASTNELDKYNQ